MVSELQARVIVEASMSEMYAGKVGNPGRGITVIPGGEGTPIPDPPASWPANTNSREIWTRLWTVGRSWLSNEAHFDLMRVICEAIDDRDRIRRRLLRSALMVTGSAGQEQVHPGWRHLNDAESKVARLLDQAGFSPAKRRIETQSSKSKSKLDEMRDKVKAGRVQGDTG
jgi:hypothetical protein